MLSAGAFPPSYHPPDVVWQRVRTGSSRRARRRRGSSPRAEPTTDLHMSAPIGRRLPANVGAHAKVLTGGADIGLDDEEYLPGVRAVAAPIIDAHGRRIAVLIVVGSKERIDMRTLKRIGE